MEKSIPRLFTDSIKIQFGQELKKRLKENGIKYRYVAERIGITPAYLAKILKGHDFPSNHAIRVIAEILHTNPHELLETIKYPDNLADWLDVYALEGE